MTRLYICAPMSGIPEFNHPAINQAAVELRDCGYDVVSPAEIEGSTTREYEDLMGDCLTMLGNCHGIAYLPGAHASAGGYRELVRAKELGLAVHPVFLWIGWKCPSKRSAS